MDREVAPCRRGRQAVARSDRGQAGVNINTALRTSGVDDNVACRGLDGTAAVQSQTPGACWPRRVAPPDGDVAVGFDVA